MLRFKKKVVMLVSGLMVAFSGQFALAAVGDNPTGVCPQNDQIDWSKVPGSSKSSTNDVTRDFLTVGDPLNDILANDFTAWEPKQRDINGAFTSTGRAQRQAVLGDASKQVHGAKSNC